MIVVYGKEGCGKCEAAKEKLRRLGIDYEARDAAEAMALHEGWREDGTADLRAASEAFDGDLPLLRVGGVVYDYAGAMRAIKHRRSEMARKGGEGES